MQKNSFNQSVSDGEKINARKLDFIFSSYVRSLSTGGKTAFIAVFAALSVITNTYLEFRMLDVQFSLTIFISVIIGVALGPLAGGASSLLGDFLGYVLCSWGQLYMPWVGLSTAMLSFLSGLVNAVFNKNFRNSFFYLRYIIICVLSFFVCTVAINSTGFYFYNKINGFSSAVLDYVASRFGGSVSYLAYLCYRLFFKCQIYNNIFNYALLFVFLPVLKRIPKIKDFFS